MIGGFSHFFHEELARRIAAKIAETKDQMGRGAVVDFTDYKQAVGYINGLNEALELADEIKKEHDRA